MRPITFHYSIYQQCVASHVLVMSAAGDSCATSQPSSILISTGHSAVTHFAFQLFAETEGMYQPSRNLPETQLSSHI